MGELLYPLGLTKEERASLPVPDYSLPYYRMNVSLKEIRSYLKQVNDCIRRDSFVVLEGDQDNPLDTRYKNTEFMFLYGLLNRESQKQLLLSVSEEEFCHVILSNDGRKLYVFCIDRMLFRMMHGYEKVRIYLKHDYRPSGDSFDIVISLHALELPILRAFED